MQPEISDQTFYSFLTGGLCSSSPTTTTLASFFPFAIEEDTISQDKANSASRKHKETERRRRERINSRLNKLRELLPCNSKTDKATVLAKVVQRIKELKQQTLEVTNESLPSEGDEVSVHNFEDCSNDYNDRNQIIFKILFCCEDRPDLMQDLVETLKSLKMQTLYADMTTIGGRTRNVLVVAADKEHNDRVKLMQFLENALKSMLERSSHSVMTRPSGGGKSKRRREQDHIIMV